VGVLRTELLVGEHRDAGDVAGIGDGAVPTKSQIRGASFQTIFMARPYPAACCWRLRAVDADARAWSKLLLQ